MILPECTEQELLKGMEEVIEKQLPLLKTVEESWQPSDFLPDLTRTDWREEVGALRALAANLSDEVLVVLVGNLVTEEALPSYQTWLNRVNGLKDETGTSPGPWGLWTRGWTAEENRHGDLLNKYLYLCGRVNTRSVEVTIQHLIKNGFDARSGGDPYPSMVYTSFQERATKISHTNTGRLAEKCGDTTLNRMCSVIAGDEARHEEAYKRFFACAIELDASRAVIAFAQMMRKKIAMPARLMSDGTGRNLFSQFAAVAQRTGVYTVRDYAEVIQHLVDFWHIGSLSNLSDEAARCQDYLCGLSDHYLQKADRIEELLERVPKEPFSWIFDRHA